MNKNILLKLRKKYEESLLKDVAPFWTKYSPDTKYGGYFTCLDRKGRLYSSDKSGWFQGRHLWMFSALLSYYPANRARNNWLGCAELGAQFIEKYCFDNDRRMYFSLTREGKPLRKRRYLFSECFASAGFAALHEITGDKKQLQLAREIYRLILKYYTTPGLLEPKVNPEARKSKSLSLPMIFLSVSQILRHADPANKSQYQKVIEGLLRELFTDFYKPAQGIIYETVGLHGEKIDTPEGRCINPGHAIECSWFLLEEGAYRNDKTIISKALSILDGASAIGWDKRCGGIIYYKDIENKPVQQLEWDMKLWWPHCEALIATLLAYRVTGSANYLKQHLKISDYFFRYFKDRTYPEFYGYLHRDNSVSMEHKGSLWKGFFHIPRALLKCIKTIDEITGRNN